MKIVSKKVGIIAVAIVVVLVILAIGTGAFTDPNYPTPWDPDPPTSDLAGEWGVNIILEYTDGTTDELKILQGSFLLSTWYGSKQISGMKYVLHGRASGTGYTKCQVNSNDMKMTIRTYDSAGNVKKTRGPFAMGWTEGSSSRQIPLDDDWHQLWSGGYPIGELVTQTWNPGFYKVKWEPSGTPTYQSIPSGASGTLDTPNTLSLTVELKSDKTLTIGLSSEVETW